MKTQRLLTSLLLVFATTSLAVHAHAADFLDTAEKYFYAPMANQKFGIEVEMMGLEQQPIVDIVQKHFGGIAGISDHKGTITIKNTKIGDIDIKLEVNETSDDPTIKWDTSKNVIELVTQPITEDQVALLDVVMKDLKRSGAIGTDGKNPISIQVNVGMMEGTPDQQAKDVVNIMRTYYGNSHQEQIRAASLVPEGRWPYLRDYSEGFMKRLFESDYNPTAKDFYFDFIYRQALEHSLKHNKQAAWSMSEADVREMIVKLGYPVHVEIIKLNQMKVASLLLKWFPEDPYSKAIVKQGWIKAAPLIEYRIFNNDFKVWPKVRQVMGIHRMAKMFNGTFNHDNYMANKLGISVEEVRKSRGGMMCEGQF